MVKKALILLLLAGALCAGIPLYLLGSGWLKFKRLETSIVDKLDRYYLNITTPGREEYLLSDDEIFEVPYMASQLSVEAAPTRIYDRGGILLGEFLEARGLYVRSSDDLPGFLKKAVVAAEDGDFYEHRGVNWKAVGRAMLKNIRSGHTAQGGSTLTQQLAKIMFTTRERTLSRKVFELFCAKKIEEKFTKEQILLMYLNFLYLGHGCFGVECAAQYYFAKPASALELGESAMLAGIIASPNNYSPFRKIELSQARHRTVLHRMAQRGFIPEASIERYSREFWEKMEGQLEAPEASIRRMRVNRSPYFIEYIRQELEREFPRARLLKGGLQIHTTLDLGMQEAAKEALSGGLEEVRAAAGKPDRASAVEGGLAAVDSRDGAIRALVGGSGFTFRNQFNRAVNGRRPVGSALKPFIYAAAFADGLFKPEDKFVDAVASYPRGRGRKWTPRNYGGKYYGEVPLSTALQKSLNTVAVKLLARINIDRVRRLLAAVSGAEANNFPRDLTLALGSAGLTPLELAASYAVFANGGRPVRPFAIVRITDRDGRQVPFHEPAPPGEPVLSTAACRTVRIILESVLREGGTAYGAARRTGFSLAAAGKTGTTNGYRDAWFAGITPELAAAVRVGNDDMRVALGPGGTGGGVAAPIWMRFLKEAYRNRPAPAFDGPEVIKSQP
ncbi:MAG: PBP1A family penicillin-binding protein [Elusimicrobiota bacterium]